MLPDDGKVATSIQAVYQEVNQGTPKYIKKENDIEQVTYNLSD